MITVWIELDVVWIELVAAVVVVTVVEAVEGPGADSSYQTGQMQQLPGKADKDLVRGYRFPQ